MANIKSSKKRIMIARRNAARNLKIKNELRDLLKKVVKKHAKKEDPAEVLMKTIKKLDRAVSKGVFHWKTAARKKSRLVKKYSRSK